LVAGAAVRVTGSEEPYFSIPAKAAVTLSRAVGEPGSDLREATPEWPSSLSSVSELLPLRFSQIVRAMDGIAVFLASLVGLLLLPMDRWRWWHGAGLAISPLFYGYGLVARELSPGVLLAVLGGPLAAALIMQWWGDTEPPPARQGAALVLIVWFLAATMTSF